MIRSSCSTLTSIILRRAYTGYQQGSKNRHNFDDFELYADEPNEAENRIFYDKSKLSSLRTKEKISDDREIEDSKHFSTTHRSESNTNANKTFVPSSNPYASKSSRTMPFSHIPPQESYRSPPSVDGNEDDPAFDSSDQLQPSPFKSTGFSTTCMSALPDKKNILSTINQAMKPRAGKESFDKSKNMVRATINLKQRKLQQKKLNDLIVKEIMMLFRLYKDQESIIPLHLTKISSGLGDETLEYLGEKGGLRKFLTDRPKYFRLKKMERSGGWYVTTSVDACESFAGNFHRSISSTFDEEVPQGLDEVISMKDGLDSIQES